MATKTNSQVSTLDDAAPVAAAAAAQAEAAPVVGRNHDDQLSGDRRLITIHPTEGDSGSDAVFVSLNGYAFQIPRGTPQNVPVEVIEIIKNAKITHRNAGPGGVPIERTVQRYAYTLE